MKKNLHPGATKNLFENSFLAPLILLFVSLICVTSSAQFGTSPWTAPNGTFTVPAGVTSITVECWGGGGGGGGAKERGLVQCEGGGGGGGANAKTTSFAVTPGETITVTNGAGGTAGASTPTAGGAGGASSVVYNVGAVTVAQAAGGGGGDFGYDTPGNNYGTAGIGASTGTGTIHNGGNGAAGSNANGGGGGGSGGDTGNGLPGISSNGGAGGTTNGGNGGDGASVTNPGSAPGSPGSAPGGGGGAAGASDFNNQITRSAAGGMGGAGRVIITYTVQVCTPPTTQATGPVTFNSITETSLNYAFTRGNGDNVLVICKAGSAVNPDPVNGSSFTANSTYGSGTGVGGGYCVYNGTAAGAGVATGDIAVTGLTCFTTYYFAVYEYNTIGTCYVTPALTGNVSVTCSSAPAAAISNAGTAVAATSFTANWTATACATGYRLDVSTDILFSTYVAGYQDLDVGNVLSQNITGLASGTTYYYRVRAYNICGTSTSSGLITVTTLAVPSVISFTPTSACSGSGTVVTITGTNFNGATGVNFNGTAATFTVNSSTEIVATLPASATTGTVTVTGPGGTGTSSSSFTVNPIPVATTTPSAQTICSGSNAAIALSSSVGGSSYSWTRTTPSSITGTMPASGSTDPDGTLISSASTAVTVTFTVTPSANGCTGNAVTAGVTVQSIPDMPSTISGLDTVCSGGTYTYSITSVSGATSYTWTLPNGWTGSSTTTTISPSSGSAGGDITITANNNCGSSTAQTKAVYVTPAVTTPGAITGPDSLCNGSSGLFTIAPANGATSYTWTLPSGWSGSSSSESLNATAGSTGGNVTVVANNACGSSGAQTHAVSISTSAPTLGTISGLTAVCSGSVNTYSVTAVGGASSYVWTLPSGWSGSSTTNSISATADATGGTISVTASSTCGNSSPQTLAVSIISSPATPVIITGPPSICSGTTNSYSVAAVNGATGYTWTLPNGWTGSSSTETISAMASSTAGNVLVTADNNCGSSTAQTLAVSIETPPATPGTVSGPTSVCTGSSGSYSVASVSGATGYTWTLPNGWTGSSSSESINTTSGSTGGSISVTADNTCGSSSAQSKSVTVNPLPQVSFNFTQNPVCKNASPVVLTGSPAGGTYSGQGVSGGTFNPASLSAGSYLITYTYTDGNGCSASDTATFTVTICSGISMVDENNIEIYPNPFSNELMITTTGAFEKGTVTLYNVIGKEVESFDLPLVTQRLRINTNGLAKGVYLIEVKQSENTRVLRVVKSE